MERMYDLHWHNNGKPCGVVGGGKWQPMTHAEAITARSKFSQSSRIMLVECEPLGAVQSDQVEAD